MGLNGNDMVFLALICFASYLWFNNRVKNSGTVSISETSLKEKTSGQRLSSPSPHMSGGNVNLSEFDFAAYEQSDNLPKSKPGIWNSNELLPSNGAIDFKDTNFLMSPLQQAGTIVDSTRNANYQYRRDPIIKKFEVGPWSNTTINPDPYRKSIDPDSHH